MAIMMICNRHVRHMQELDEPGEWWLERVTGQLFIYPPTASPAAALEVSTPVEWATVSAADAALVSFTRVRDIQWLGIGVGQSRGSAFLIKNCSRLLLQNVTVKGMAVQAAVVDGGVNVTLAGWAVSRTGQGGIKISGGDRPTLTPCGHVVVDSELSFTDNWAHYESPPLTQAGVGTRVEHNFIHDVKHHAFRLEGNEHRITANLVQHTLLEAWDAGTFHTGRDLTWRGNVLADNVLINDDASSSLKFPCIGTTTSCAKVGIYLDDHMSGVTVASNVIAGYWTGAFLHYGRSNGIVGNMFIENGISVALAACSPNDKHCNLPLEDASDLMLTALRDAMTWPEWGSLWLRRYPALRNITWNPGATANNTISGNVVIDSTGQGFPIGGGSFNATSMPGAYRLYNPDGPPPYTLSDPGALALTDSNFHGWNGSVLETVDFVAEDPLGALDFTLEPTSPVFASILAWRQIPAGVGPSGGVPPAPPAPPPPPRAPKPLERCGSVRALPDPPVDEVGPTLLYLPPPTGTGIGTFIAAGQGVF
jgi:hypothetical protein